MTTDWIYQLIMGLALVSAYLISRRTQQALEITRLEKLGLLVGAFCGAMIGAKLPFILGGGPGMSGLAWFRDGKTIVCGLAGGYLGVEIAKWVMEVKVRSGDSFAVPVAVAIAVGRLGCFHAQCCFGTPTELPWGVAFTKIDHQLRHPTQLYESAFHLLAAIGLYVLGRRRIFSGNLFKLYIISYACYRFLSEFIRPEARIWIGLTAYQWACIGLVIVFGRLWYGDARKAAAKPAARQAATPGPDG